MLAMHPKIDETLYSEITEYYKIDNDLNYETVKKMPYLDMVVKEVLRLFPVVPVTAKESLCDTFVGESCLLIMRKTFKLLIF